MRNSLRLIVLNSLFALCLSDSTGARAEDLYVPNEVYGVDNLNPSPDSLVGRYLKESGAYSFPRKFTIAGVEGPARLVVSVSQASFPILAKYFSGKEFLHVFHEPLTHIMQTAFGGKRGVMARLSDDFIYTQSGVDLVPICLNEQESQRADLYFQLAEATPRKFDVANFPWLLLDDQGKPYQPVGNKTSLSEWFGNFPIGTDFDQSQSHSNYVLKGLSTAAQKIVHDVWSVPYSHQPLIQMLGLVPYGPKYAFSTPGRITLSLLASASVQRVPVFFRFVNDHQAVLDKNFDLWLDVTFDPTKEAAK